MEARLTAEMFSVPEVMSEGAYSASVFTSAVGARGGTSLRELTTVQNYRSIVFGMSKVITPHFEGLIDRFIASGRFNNKSEVIRAGLRLLEEHETKASAAGREDLSRIIQTALKDPRPLVPAIDLLRRRQS